MKNIILIAVIALVAYWFFVLKKGALEVPVAPTTINVDWGDIESHGPIIPYFHPRLIQ